MPLVDITMAEGRSDEAIRALITAVTDAVEQTVAARRESIRVIVREVSTDRWANGGVTLTELRAERGEGAR
jgi:4-oxalocrotonate tautomerase